MANKRRVLIYGQIYQKAWGEEAYGDESNAIGCYICNNKEIGQNDSDCGTSAVLLFVVEIVNNTKGMSKAP